MKHVDYVRARRRRECRDDHVARDARPLAPNIRELHRNYYLATSTAVAVTLYEDEVPQ